jgi:hypothetical protein
MDSRNTTGTFALFNTNPYNSEINLKDIFTEEEYKLIEKLICDEEVREKLSQVSQKKIITELKRSNSKNKKSNHLFNKSDFIFKLLKICVQKLKTSKEPALSKGLDW